MRQFLEKTTQPVDPGEVAKQISALEAGLKGQGKSLAEFLHDSYRTPEQFKADVADHLRWTAYCAKQYPDTLVEQYYKENKDVFDKVTVRASHMVLRRVATRHGDRETQRPGQAGGDPESLLANPPGDFSALAKQYSQGPEAAKGGDLGWFPRKWFYDEDFSKAAFALPIGQVSEVVQTDFGLHLIKVTERRPGEKSEFSKIKEAVRTFCEEDMRAATPRRTGARLPRSPLARSDWFLSQRLRENPSPIPLSKREGSRKGLAPLSLVLRGPDWVGGEGLSLLFSGSPSPLRGGGGGGVLLREVCPVFFFRSRPLTPLVESNRSRVLPHEQVLLSCAGGLPPTTF